MSRRGGGKRGGGGRGGGGGGGPHEDQYGEFRSQDRDEQFSNSFGGKSMNGGGSAGGATKSGPNVSFERHVPKFLQPYAHMLGGKRKQPAHRILTEEFEDADEDDTDAIQRALEENPHLEAEVGEKYMKKVQAANEKEKGNTAFTEKKYADAIQHFTKCIELDPEDEVFYSNRSAAFAASGDYHSALADAQKAVAKKPNWVKGHARKGAAYFGMKMYTDAKEAYERAMELEPDDASLQQGYEKALMAEMQQIGNKKHIFKKREAAAPPTKKQKPAEDKKSTQGKVVLSFAADDEEET